MAMCVIAVVAVAPCQCFSPGENQMTSPGRISSLGPPQRCAQPQPAVTINVWPSGWVCQAVRAPGSKVTLAPATRAGSGGGLRADSLDLHGVSPGGLSVDGPSQRLKQQILPTVREIPWQRPICWVAIA